MQALSKQFLEECPVEDGFRIRGKEMTRIEVFVDASFAFAVTLLVISFDAIPENFPEMVNAIKGIPAFAASVAMLIWIWHSHNIWSRRFGLEDAMTVFLSALLLIVVLIYIYPLRVMLGGLFSWITGQFLFSPFQYQSYQELRFMFVFMGIAFAAVCFTFLLMYRHALSRADFLLLDERERRRSATMVRNWAGCMVISLMPVALALTLPDGLVPLSGFSLILIGAWMPYSESLGRKARHSPENLE